MTLNFTLNKVGQIGLDISSTSVKLLELKSNKSGYTVVSYIVEPLPANAVNEKAIQDIEVVGEAIRRAMKRANTRTKLAAIAVPSAMVITKIVSMPADLRDHEMEAQIHLESDQYIPYPLEEINLDFQVLGPSDDGPGLVNVLLAASRSENVEDRTAAAEIGGLTVKIVDVEPYTMETAYTLLKHQLIDGGDDKTIAILDIGATMTSLSVIRNHMLIYTREQPFGGKQLTEEIMRRYGLSYEDAGRVKRTGGLPDNYEAEVLEPFKQLLVQQVNRYLQFFFTGDKNDYVDQIVVAGGSATIEGVSQLIEQEIGTPTVVANPFESVKFDASVDQKRIMGDGPALMIACGLALRGFD